jgi:hypothetical protein
MYQLAEESTVLEAAKHERERRKMRSPEAKQAVHSAIIERFRKEADKKPNPIFYVSSKCECPSCSHVAPIKVVNCLNVFSQDLPMDYLAQTQHEVSMPGERDRGTRDA